MEMVHNPDTDTTHTMVRNLLISSVRSPVLGFSLVSLIIAMTVLGILAAVAIPGWDGLVGIKLGSASRRVMTDLRYAQDLAIRVGVIHSVTFRGSGYQIRKQGAGVIEDPSYRGRLFAVDLASEYPGIGIAATFPGGSTVYFNRKGGTTGGGRVVISLAGESVTIYVEDGTGRISY
jgi:Tfp pilus assembly protein FimT